MALYRAMRYQWAWRSPNKELMGQSLIFCHGKDRQGVAVEACVLILSMRPDLIGCHGCGILEEANQSGITARSRFCSLATCS